MALLKVKVETGLVEGLPAGNQAVSVFKGVPFAAPPVGELRWKEPQPAKPWVGVKKCYSYSDIPMQRRMNTEGPTAFLAREFYPIKFPRSEDCLYLNIWTPADSEDANLPVCMWIFGGGNFQGYANKQEFDGEAYAKRGVIYVSINYRLNMFGFLTHPELTAESPNKVSGNYGLFDQIAAIRWIKRNIKAFGGNPNQITIFGQSGGGGDVQMLLASPLTRGDFEGAIMQSAGGMGIQVRLTLAEQEKIGEEFFKFAGVKNLAEARALDAETFFEFHEKFKWTKNTFGSPFGPVVDGYFMPNQPEAIFLSGDYPDMPVMIGCTADETIPESGRVGTLESLRASLKPVLGEEYIEKFFEAAGIKTDDDAAEYNYKRSMITKFAADTAWCEMKYEQGKTPSYMYVFTHVPPGEPNIGAFHSCEHMYLNQTFLRSWRPYKGEDFDLSNTMSSYWCNFMKNGNPNGEGLEQWNPYTKDAHEAMELKPNGKMFKPELTPAEIFLRDFVLKRI